MNRRLIVIAAFLLVSRPAPGQIWDNCGSEAETAPGPHCWVVCPAGDGPPLSDLHPASGDATITVTVLDLILDPIPNIPASDFWLVTEDATAGGQMFLCGGAAAIDATGPTDASGQTTIAGSLAGSACDEGVVVVVQGVILKDADCNTIVLDIAIRSPDTNLDSRVDAVDFTFFGNAWPVSGGTYSPCVDFDCDGDIDAMDFTQFGNHWLHACL